VINTQNLIKKISNLYLWISNTGHQYSILITLDGCLLFFDILSKKISLMFKFDFMIIEIYLIEIEKLTYLIIYTDLK